MPLFSSDRSCPAFLLIGMLSINYVGLPEAIMSVAIEKDRGELSCWVLHVQISRTVFSLTPKSPPYVQGRDVKK